MIAGWCVHCAEIIFTGLQLAGKGEGESLSLPPPIHPLGRGVGGARPCPFSKIWNIDKCSLNVYNIFIQKCRNVFWAAFFAKLVFFLKISTVVTNIKRNDCRLLNNGIYISKKERRRKLFRFNLVTTVENMLVAPLFCLQLHKYKYIYK